MSQFVYLFRSTDADARAHMGTPEMARKSMETWLTWLRELEAGGHLVNAGQPLDRGGKVVKGRERNVTDGPFVEGKDLVLGFIVIEAADLEQAVALSRACPMLEGAGSVEIRPVGVMP